VATQLAARGEMNIDAADIGVAITRITDELPSQADLDRTASAGDDWLAR
jgi:hypothetical protein